MYVNTNLFGFFLFKFGIYISRIRAYIFISLPCINDHIKNAYDSIVHLNKYFFYHRSIRRFVRACEQATVSIFGYFFFSRKVVPYNYASFGTEKKNFGQITNNLIYMWNFPTIGTHTTRTFEYE